ncbi:hypothetical protein ACS0TY_007818 [Phlomoides rotata]
MMPKPSRELKSLKEKQFEQDEQIKRMQANEDNEMLSLSNKIRLFIRFKQITEQPYSITIWLTFSFLPQGFRKCHGDVSSAEQENRGEILTIKHDLNRGDDSRIDTEEEWVKTDVKRVTKRKKLLVHDQVSWSCNGCTITNRASHFIQKNVEFRPPCTTIVPWSCRGARSCTLEVKTR